MKITINTEDGSGLGTVTISYEGSLTTDDSGELLILIKRLMDMEDTIMEDKQKGNSAELLLVKGKEKSDKINKKAYQKIPKDEVKPTSKKKVATSESTYKTTSSYKKKQEKSSIVIQQKRKVGRPRKNDEFSPYREKPNIEVVGDIDEGVDGNE